MASPPLAGRYALYKEGTAKLVRWLKTNASLSSAAYANAYLKVIVSTGDLLPFAGAIAGVGASVRIPGSLLDLILDVITGRQVCADWYASPASEPAVDTAAEETSNRAHRHFITVLQEIYDTLSAARMKQKEARPVRPSAASFTTRSETEAKTSLTSLFESLGLEEPSANPLSDALQASPEEVMVETSVPDEGASLELDEQAEKEFALWCVLKDLKEIRDYIRSIWADYAEGKLSFMVASTITNAAFGMMRRTDEELTDTYPDLGDFENVLATLGLEMYVEDHRPFIKPKNSNVRIDNNVDLSDLLCPFAAHMLSLVRAVWLAAKREEDKLQHTAASDGELSSQGAEAATNGPKEVGLEEMTEKWCPYNPFLSKLLSKLAGLSRYIEWKMDQTTGSLEEFLHGFWQTYQTNEVSMWFVVACQTYTDISDVVSGSLDMGLVRLSRVVQEARATETAYRSFIKKHQLVIPDADHAFALLAQATMFDKDLITAWSQYDQAGGDGLPSNEHQADTSQGDGQFWCHLLDQLFVCPSVRISMHKVVMHIVGVSLADHCLSIVMMAHLYSAAKHYGILESTWVDME